MSGRGSLIVAGGCGFIGSTFVRRAMEYGYRVVVLDALTYAGHRENLEGVTCELRVGNITDGPLVAELFQKYQPVAILNFAAESHVDRSINSPSPFIETNIRGTFQLLNTSMNYWQGLGASEQGRFRFIQVSTDEVFGSLGPTGKFSEKSPFAPNSPYSASKAAGDHLVRAWHHTYQLPTLTTHCSNNYGPRQHPEKLIPRMITCALNGKPLPVYGDGENIRDWIHVDDHCDGIFLALEKGKPGSSYCFGGNAEKKNLDVVRGICKQLDRLSPRKDGKPHESAIGFVTDRPGHDRRYAIDDRLAQSELGFRHSHDFESGLAETVEWYLNNPVWCQAVMTPARA